MINIRKIDFFFLFLCELQNTNKIKKYNMRNIFVKKVLVLFSLIFPIIASAQDCIDYQKKCREKKDVTTSYSYSDFSRSGLLLKGQVSEFNIDLYQGKDYRITLCYDAVLGEKVQYKIIDYDYGDILYNNADFNFATEFEFTVLQSRKVKIEVSVPADDKTKQTTAIGLKPKPTQMGCVGVLVEFMVTPRKGF